MRARSAERARIQWESALGGSIAHAVAGELVFRWPGSPMRIVVEIAPDGEEGPVAIEIGPAPHVALPDGPVAPLGTTFRVDRDSPES
jgi:hypothetical protein